MKVRRPLWTIVDALLLVSGAGMLITVVIQVGSRIIGLAHYVPWTEEMTRNLFVLAVFMGLAVGFRRAEHARITFFLQVLPKAVQRMAVHIYFVGGFLFFSVLTYEGILMTLQKLRSGEMSPASGIPMFLVTLPIPIAAVLAIIGQFQSVYIDNTTRDILQHGGSEHFIGDDSGASDGERATK